MATRAIVTSPPVVACDVCGRRLLRGETPDVFLAGGQRRTVCELCAPRATAEGWLREADGHELSLRPARPRRAGSLLGRLRQLREPPEAAPRSARSGRRRAAVESEDLYDEAERLYDLLDGPEGRDDDGAGFGDDGAGLGDAARGDEHTQAVPAARRSAEPAMSEAEPAISDAATLDGGPGAAKRALAVFNASETPQRVAGVSRSLGAPTVVVRALAHAATRVAIVVAWELCWYRYEVDLGDEAAGVQLVAEGMELDELSSEDRVGNAVADERGELSLL